MRVRTSLLLALLCGLVGIGLRLAVPVRPVDAPFREVIRFYDALEPEAR